MCCQSTCLIYAQLVSVRIAADYGVIGCERMIPVDHVILIALHKHQAGHSDSKNDSKMFCLSM